MRDRRQRDHLDFVRQEQPRHINDTSLLVARAPVDRDLAAELVLEVLLGLEDLQFRLELFDP
jgi:hypothetical protein